MGLFDKIKNVLGVKQPEPVPATPVVEKPAEVTPKEKVESATTKVKPVTVKAKKATADKPKRETRKSLEKLTKVQIDELAAERFGVELDRRKKKEAMIDEFMAAQKKAK